MLLRVLLLVAGWAVSISAIPTALETVSPDPVGSEMTITKC